MSRPHTPSGRSGAAATDSLLDAAWRALTGADLAPPPLTLSTWQPGMLPSRLAALPAMTAAAAASTLAVAVLDGARQGQTPSVAVLDVEHVAAAARSERHARVVGSDVPDLFAPLSRFWRTADGWARVHTNYGRTPLWRATTSLGVDAPSFLPAS